MSGDKDYLEPSVSKGEKTGAISKSTAVSKESSSITGKESFLPAEKHTSGDKTGEKSSSEPLAESIESQSYSEDNHVDKQATSSSESSGTSEKSDELDPAVALQMRKDFVEFLKKEFGNFKLFTLENVSVQEYFGNYSGCEVAYMGAPLLYTQALRNEIIAGVPFVFSNGQEIYVYKDSNFYTLKKAFEAQYITHDDVFAIRNEYFGRRPWLMQYFKYGSD